MAQDKIKNEPIINVSLYIDSIPAGKQVTHTKEQLRDLIRAALDEATEIMSYFYIDEACRFDHHGNCQEHDFVLEPGEKCPNVLVKEFLERQ